MTTKSDEKPKEKKTKGEKEEKKEEIKTSTILDTSDQNIEALGATRFSLYTAFGFDNDLSELIENYQDYFREKI